MSANVVVDSSVVDAIFKREPDAPKCAERLLSFDRRLISAVDLLEPAIVCEEWAKPAGREEYDKVVSLLALEVAPATPAQAEIAREAHRRFGKGRGRPAVLNFGDCFAYALAKDLGARCCSRATTSRRQIFPPHSSAPLAKAGA